MIKEVALSFIYSRNVMFSLRVPKPDDYPNEIEFMDAIGFRVSRPSGKREDYKSTSERVKMSARILFALHLSDAYIGRLFQMLVVYLHLPFTQLSSQILFHLLEMGGKKLLQVYKSAFAKIVQNLLQEYIPTYEKYSDDPNGMSKEVQNKAQYLSLGSDEVPDKHSTGIKTAQVFTDKLKDLCDDLKRDLQ